MSPIIKGGTVMNTNFIKKTAGTLIFTALTASFGCSAFANNITIVKSIGNPEYTETIIINDDNIKVIKSDGITQSDINIVNDKINDIKKSIIQKLNSSINNDTETSEDENTDDKATIYSEYITKVIELTNTERSKYNLPPLKLSNSLCKSAQEHADDMYINNYFSHTSKDGRTMSDRIEKYSSSYGYKGENIAFGYDSPEAVVNGWLNSDGHRANILNKNYTDIGVGYSNGYWVQNFGG